MGKDAKVTKLVFLLLGRYKGSGALWLPHLNLLIYIFQIKTKSEAMDPFTK
jgi:hypothetical protein